MKAAKLIQQIDAVLPQTQCGECDYAGCKPYAEAIATKGEAINRCPPGGITTLHKLADITGQDPTPYLAEMQQKQKMPSVAVIREQDCIGCTKCIQACPVDAIVGAAKQMHTVISQECTGCELCVEPCPVDCIDIVTLPKRHYDPDIARQRYQFRNLRLARDKQVHYQKHQQAKHAKKSGRDKIIAARKADIAAIMARAKNKKRFPSGSN